LRGINYIPKFRFKITVSGLLYIALAPMVVKFGGQLLHTKFHSISATWPCS